MAGKWEAGKREEAKRDARKPAASPLMPGARVRGDGWTNARTKMFLGKLAQTGCVTDAARVAGISRNSARRGTRALCRGRWRSALGRRRRPPFQMAKMA